MARTMESVRALPFAGMLRSPQLVNVAQVSLVLLQLAVLAIVIRQFQLVNSAFLRVALLTFAGFAVHHFLPQRYRMHFFLLLSFAGIVLVFGLLSGAMLIGVGGVLVLGCYLPISFAGRITFLIACAILLAAFRVDWISAPSASPILPILGSMFMFRLMVYLYDTREKSHEEPVVRTLSYFFMLPNVCFPLFPVVDYARFRRGYYNEDAYKIYQTGIRWMVYGVTHLIAYRAVYYYAAIDPSEAESGLDVARYLISTFLLYLQISGQFHLIVGMLHLFGFNLPRTNDRYLLASSFNDFWRRINIYWKDFMVKVLYYPLYFQLRRFGDNKALVISTFLVFIATWVLHSYQWFWLRGSFPILWQDGVYWMVLAGLVAANTLYEKKYGTRRLVTGNRVLSQLLHALRIIGTMSVILILWSLWMTESFAAWLSLWTI
jgi:D-alanyl-lipoteichoic acid acyltransferase DltB (MBOAT superfamily)